MRNSTIFVLRQRNYSFSNSFDPDAQSSVNYVLCCASLLEVWKMHVSEP